MRKIIKNGIIVTDSNEYKSDVLIDGEKIVAIGSDFNYKDIDIIDATGCYVLPGGIDVHTHFDLQAGDHRAVDDYYTGSIAAACGGTTTIVDHISFGPSGCSLHYQIDEYYKLSNNKSVVDYSFHGVIQHVNDNILDEMEELFNEGITSMKIYMTYDSKLDDESIYEVLKKAKELGMIIAVHAENDGVINHLREKFAKENLLKPIYHAKSRPEECEAEAVSRISHIASILDDAPLYIVHLSSEKGLIECKKVIDSNQKNFFVETCTQYLLLTEDKYNDDIEGLKYTMSPPLRKENDIEALWEGIREGYIKIVATDHCPFNFETKIKYGKDNFITCPMGFPGVEERFPLMFSEGVMKNRISINKFVEVVSTNPAKAYGLYPEKGVILPGSDADIVIMDPNLKSTISISNRHSNVDYCGYEGKEIQGTIKIVMQRGNILYNDGKFLGEKGDGKFIKRHRSGMISY